MREGCKRKRRSNVKLAASSSLLYSVSSVKRVSRRADDYQVRRSLTWCPFHLSDFLLLLSLYFIHPSTSHSQFFPRRAKLLAEFCTKRRNDDALPSSSYVLLEKWKEWRKEMRPEGDEGKRWPVSASRLHFRDGRRERGEVPSFFFCFVTCFVASCSWVEGALNRLSFVADPGKKWEERMKSLK